MFKTLGLFASLFISLLLLALSLSSLIIYLGSNITLNSYIITVLILFLSIALLFSKIKQGFLIILLSLLAMLSHMLFLYLLLPVGWSSDQRVYFIDAIEKTGNIGVLGTFSREGLYYIRYPVPWLEALLIKLLLGIESGSSWLLTIATVYLSFLIFLLLIYKSLINATNRFKETALKDLAWLILITEFTIYLHSPFLNLIPSAFGLLSFAMVLYLYFSNNSNRKQTSVLLPALIPLLIAHGLSIYISIIYLLLVAFLFTLVQDRKKDAQKAILFIIIILAGTWLY